MKEELNRLKEMMSPDYDWEKHYDKNLDGIEDIFRKYFLTILPASNLKGFECIGFDIDDTPRALYRALYLGKPESVDFSDMYKTGMLFGFASPCGSFFSIITLFKYEFGVYCYCKNREDISGQLYGVRGGWPSCDNGVCCNSPNGQLWFDVLKMALNFKHGVYPGNNFEV